MENGTDALHFFLGANTPQGFVSRFDQLGRPEDGWRKFVIKGGPGTGKSAMMNRLVQEMEPYGGALELIHCSSDIRSLDAVLVHKIKACIADGTAPHVIEPEFPGAFESIVCLSECWNEEALQQRRMQIVEAWRAVGRCHERCCRFLAAAGSLLGDSYRIASEHVDPDKIARYAARLAHREFGVRQAGQRGREAVRFLSAVTAEGITTFESTPQTLCERLYLVEDDQGAVSRLLLAALRAHALAAGLDVISCYCVMAPYEKLEHLLIPSLGLGFLTANRYHPFASIPCFRRVHARRFMDTDGLRTKRQRLSFNRKAIGELLDEASNRLAEAKEEHDLLEAFYTPQMDFDQVNQKAEHVLDSFLGFQIGGDCPYNNSCL